MAPFPRLIHSKDRTSPSRALRFSGFRNIPFFFRTQVLCSHTDSVTMLFVVTQRFDLRRRSEDAVLFTVAWAKAADFPSQPLTPAIICKVRDCEERENLWRSDPLRTSNRARLGRAISE